MMFHCKIFSILVLIQTVTVGRSQTINFGSCPAIQPLSNFNPGTKYFGLWYEYAKYPIFQELAATCIVRTYTDNGGGVIGIVYRRKIFGIEKDTSGTITPIMPNSNIAKYIVRLNTPIVEYSVGYWVLDTDFTNYSVVWSCETQWIPFVGIINTQHLWIFTRARIPTDSIVKTARTKIASLGLDLSHLKITHQTGC